MSRELVDSGIEWIGKIPSNWKLERLQWHLDEINEKNTPVKTTNILSLTNKLGVVPYSEKGNQGNVAKENYDEYKIAYPDTIVANSMNILIGSVGYCNYYGCVSPVYYVYKAKEKNSIKFWNYLFQSQQFQKELRKYANGILEIRLRVSSNDILKRYAAIPSIEEQEKIVAILDKKVQQIDALIANQEKQIEKLNEYKQAVITKAVTKGLDPNAEMKDSGVEWIGLMPEKWNTIKFKYLFNNSNTGESIDKTYWTDDETKPVFYTAGLNKIHTCYSDFPEEKLTKEEDLLMSRNGTPYVFIPDKNAMYTDHVIRVDLKKQKNKNFISYTLQQSIKNVIVDSVSLATWSISLWKQQVLTWPSDNEQEEIVRFLDKKCDEIDNLVKIKQSKIEKLQEYKKSLIYEYVTGKKRVD